jgi:hypothetical protein
MVSAKQHKANMANAAKSTGPRSEVGKARVRLNAVKHGFTSAEVVVGNEDPSEFEELTKSVIADLNPVTSIEIELAHELVGLLWRLRRVRVLEAAFLRARVEENEKSKLSEKAARVRVEDALLNRLAALLQEHSTLLSFNEAEMSAGLKKLSGPQLELLEALVDKVSDPHIREPKRYQLSMESPEVHDKICAQERAHNWSLEDDSVRAIALISDSDSHGALGKLSRYEAGLLNAITRTLSLLHSLRESRLFIERARH